MRFWLNFHLLKQTVQNGKSSLYQERVQKQIQEKSNNKEYGWIRQDKVNDHLNRKTEYGVYPGKKVQHPTIPPAFTCFYKVTGESSNGNEKDEHKGNRKGRDINRIASGQ